MSLIPKVEFEPLINSVMSKVKSTGWPLLEQTSELATDLMEKLTYSKKDFDDDLNLLLFTLREKGIEMGKLKNQKIRSLRLSNQKKSLQINTF